MRWSVRGANRETGEDVEIMVEGESRDDAVRKAGKSGMLISEVVQVAEPIHYARPTLPAPITPPPIAMQPLPVLVMKAPRRWGIMRVCGLLLVIFGLPVTCVFGIGFAMIIVGAILMWQSD